MAYSLGPVKPWVTWAANELGPKFGITTAGGYRGTADPNDHPNGHHDGLAVDFMVSDKTRGTNLANYAKANTKKYGVAYIIWRQHIWNPQRAAEGWRLMPDRGSTTANHYDHVHVSFNTTAPAGFNGSASSVQSVKGTVVPVSTFSTKAKKPTNADDNTDDTSSDTSTTGTNVAASSSLSVIDWTDIGATIRHVAILAAAVLGGVALIAVGAAAASAPARKKGGDAALDIAQLIPETAALATAAKTAQKAS